MSYADAGDRIDGLQEDCRGDGIVSLEAAHDAVIRALATGTSPAGLPAAQVFEHASLRLYLYLPRGQDHQPVHGQDEIYVVLCGTGTFARGACEATLVRAPFGPGDAIFVPAGMLHRFEGFSDDLTIWVVMYGPEGGETAAQ